MNEGRRLLSELYRAALSGADPRRRVEAALGEVKVERILRLAREVGVFAVGKAAAAMARGVRGRFRRGLVILPKGSPPFSLPGVEVLYSAHPEPDRSSVAAAKRALEFFVSFGPEDVILCLVSGGTSSMLALPRPGVTLLQERRAVARLASRGASILELNRLRTRLSAIKGGRLGASTPAKLVTLVLSDVPGDRAAVVGSGPTIRARRGDLVRIIGDNADGLEAAGGEARRRRLSVTRARSRLSGEAREAGKRFARRAIRLLPGEALVAGGETTVALATPRGRGGRNLEFALGAAIEIEGETGLCLLAAGSDGRDGTSRGAGAFADGRTLERARRRRLDPDRALDRHSTDAFFGRLGDLFVTGPTGGNVADWAFALRL
jgi:glycerate 2-kinase